MKVVLDTNVLIAAFITHGTCSDLFEHCVRNHTIIASEFILGEVEGHLHRKFKFSEGDVQEIMEILRAVTVRVAPQPLKEPVCRDSNDDMVLSTALSGEAKCIISGDRDLTELKQFEGIAVIQPNEFSAFEAASS